MEILCEKNGNVYQLPQSSTLQSCLSKFNGSPQPVLQPPPKTDDHQRAAFERSVATSDPQRTKLVNQKRKNV